MTITEELNIEDSTQSLRTFNIQRTCVHDGPGIRTTIFFQGCNLRCLWCQNPEGQSFQDNVASECYSTADDIMGVVLRDKEYYHATSGGVTLSGGEPFLQDPDSLISLLKLLKNEKLMVTAETSLQVPWKNINKLAPYIDLFLVDLKVVGDDKLHLELTQKDSTVIHSNIKELLELKANIKFRMVMVPGYTDHEGNIKATSQFLKSIKYNSIELMKYHNLYEDKAKKLGLAQVQLNITPEQSLESIINARKMFSDNGIKTEYIDLDSAGDKAVFTPRVRAIEKEIRNAKRGLCIDVSKWKTKYYKENGFNKPNPIHRSERLKYVLANKKIKIYDNELLVGNFTAKRVAGQLWEEYHGVLAILYLYNINRQKPVPFHISFKDQLYFYFKIFPFWVKYSLIAKVYPKMSDLITSISRLSRMNVGLNNNMLAIAHYIANYEPILELGTTGMIEKIKRIQKEKPENNQHFYRGAILGLEALEVFAERYADELLRLSKKEKNPERRKELEKMSEICRHVPKNPARTFHEALQSITFIHIALCIEGFENAISFGRLDQILYPYYKKDKGAGIITYDEAKELIALFFLKMDEVILTNDGNSFLSAYKAVETMSTDQALTFGGVDKDGKDATNEVTYMMIDVCELQTYSIDPAARVHKDSPPEYLEKIAKAHVNGSPLPQLFSDEHYIESIQKHYPVTVEQARNYAIVGCVEPNATDDHFGNTDCANVNLAQPFLQSIKGHQHDLWNTTLGEHMMVMNTNFFKFLFRGKTRFSGLVRRICNHFIHKNNIKKDLFTYDPPSSMDELLGRFQRRLIFTTKSILADHQDIEWKLKTNFTTPLASSLFPGCLETGKDVYEGGTSINSSGIQALGVTDVADSLYAINEVVFKKKLYSMHDVVRAIEMNFIGPKNQKIQAALLGVPKFGDDSDSEITMWMNKVMQIFNNALDSVFNCPREGRYSAGYYALNVANLYGRNTQALPSGRKKGVPLANSITPHYGMAQLDLLASLNSIAKLDLVEHAENGATVTFSIDSAMFKGPKGVKNLAGIYKTYLTNGGLMVQPNIINREILLDAYDHPEKYPHLLVRIAGYCAYFNDLSEGMKRTVINRTCYH